MQQTNLSPRALFDAAEGVWRRVRNAYGPHHRHYESIHTVSPLLQQNSLTKKSSTANMNNEEAPVPSSDHDQREEDRTVSRRLNRKMDIALLPFLSLLYLFNGLDRSNIGNAETQGT